MPLISGKDTLTTKIARTYDEERACRIYISRITDWRKTTSTAFEPPKNNFTGKMLLVALNIGKSLLVTKSPEEETCRIEIRDCLQNRDQLISQLYMNLHKQKR